MAPSLFKAVEPREDVLEGTLSEAIFAASLDEVVAGSASAVYGDPKTFFAGTHPSAGLKTLLDEALGRVGGGKPDAPSVIRLETNLGGGKTHNLIALYHAARGELPADRVKEFMTAKLYPKQPVDQLAVFVGTAAGAVEFPEVDSTAARTLWGHLALQLGGKDLYSYVADADQALTAPGTDALKQVLDGGSSLILIDELARYLETASGVKVGERPGTSSNCATGHDRGRRSPVTAPAGRSGCMRCVRTRAGPAPAGGRALDLVAAGKSVAEVARLLEVSDQSIYTSAAAGADRPRRAAGAELGRARRAPCGPRKDSCARDRAGRAPSRR